MTILERVNKKVKEGYIQKVAENIISQEIIIECISKSQYVDKVLMKGGIVMFNLTGDNRRASHDIDFDFVRFDISHKNNIDTFVYLLSKQTNDYDITRIGEIKELKQEDYNGKRITVVINDDTYTIRTNVDIGVHTLFAIEQNAMVFSIKEGEEAVSIYANPPEQIVAEKLYSLAKHNLRSTRYKDIFDVNYILQNCNLNKKKTLLAIELLIRYGNSFMNDLESFVNAIDETLHDKEWLDKLNTTQQNWSNTKCEDAVKTIIDFIYSL